MEKRKKNNTRASTEPIFSFLVRFIIYQATVIISFRRGKYIIFYHQTQKGGNRIEATQFIEGVPSMYSTL